MYKQFEVNNDDHNDNSTQHSPRTYINNLNEFEVILHNNKSGGGGGTVAKNLPTIHQFKKLTENHQLHQNNKLQLKQQQMQNQYWQINNNNNYNNNRLIDFKQFDKWRRSSLEKIYNNNNDENKISKKHRQHHHSHHQHHHQHQHQHQHQHHPSRYYRQHQQSGDQRPHEQQLLQQKHYLIYNGNNNNNKNRNENINSSIRECNLMRSSLSPSATYYNKDSDDDDDDDDNADNADSDIDDHFKLYGNNCDMNSYYHHHHHQILPKQSDNTKLTDINCQNPAYEQHYQHYYSYFYRTPPNTIQKQKQKQKQQQQQRSPSQHNRRKLPISPIEDWVMPYIKESSLGNSPTNENDFIGRIERINAAITETTNSQNHHNHHNRRHHNHNHNHNHSHNYNYNNNHNHNHNNYNHNVLREKVINNNNNNTNNNNNSNTNNEATYAAGGAGISTTHSKIDNGICIDACDNATTNINANGRNDNIDLHLAGHNVDDLKASGDFVEYNDDFKKKNAIVHHYLGNDVNKAERIRKIIQKNKHKVRTNLRLNGAMPSTPATMHTHHIEADDPVSNDTETIDRRQQCNNELSHSNNNDNNADDKQQPNKLPMTPFNHKAIKILKKLSPPSPRNHRILIYDTQSPRISRLGRSSHTRISRSSRFHLNQDTTMYPSGKVLEGRVQVLKSMSPIKTTEVRSKSKNGTNDIDNTDNDDDDDNDDVDNASNFDDSDASDVSSESEEGYRSYAYKLTHSLNHCASQQSLLTSSEQSLVNPINLLTPSLFPHVPPYLSFSSNIQKGPEIPADLYRVLKWRVSAVMPKVVRCILANSGMRLLKKTNDWMGVWGKHMKSPCFKSIRSYQKINHLPGSFRIGRKDSCWKNLVKLMVKYGKKDFGFMPRTYIIPNDLNQLRKSWPKYAQKNVKWIIKPPASARGAGIRVVDRWAQIPKRKPLIVQKYIERPLLINGSKFDLRLYVLVTSINPLRVYMYHNGLARFASVKYSDKSESLSDRCMHLTNYSINKLSSNYSKNEDVNACHGHKWTIKSLWNYLSNRGVRVEYLWEALRNLVLRTILAGENSINNMIKANLESKYSCFELFGFDVLLDADLVPWLLEVNISPSLHSELPLDSYVKAPLVQSVLNTALYNVPPKLSVERQREIAAEMCLPTSSICYDKRLYINYLSRMEKIKHNTFTRKTMEDRDEYVDAILERLTPDDVRCLIIAEDELARSKPLERIFPTANTYKYLKYTESPRYYNRLLDAWETRYSSKRDEGIALLRQLCEDKYHLQVPPTPAKKPIKFRTRAMRRIICCRGNPVQVPSPNFNNKLKLILSKNGSWSSYNRIISRSHSNIKSKLYLSSPIISTVSKSTNTRKYFNDTTDNDTEDTNDTDDTDTDDTDDDDNKNLCLNEM